MAGERISNRIVGPVAVLFSEYYFYLVAYNMKCTTENKTFQPEYEYPAFYRIDRIQSYRLLQDHFNIPYTQRFEPGEFRKRVQFMYGGNLLRARFRYMGPSIEAVLDRLPTAEIKEGQNGNYLIEAEVFGTGIVRWLLSQGEYVNVLGPDELREEMVRQTRKLVEYYSKRYK